MRATPTSAAYSSSLKICARRCAQRADRAPPSTRRRAIPATFGACGRRSRRRGQIPCQANVCLERTGWTRRNGGTGVGSGQESSPLQGRGLGEGACASPSLLRLAGKPASLRISPLKGRENKPQWLLSVETGRSDEPTSALQSLIRISYAL